MTLSRFSVFPKRRYCIGAQRSALSQLGLRDVAEANSAAAECGLKTGLVNGFGHGLVGLHLARLHEVQKTVVHHAHADIPARLHHRWDLEYLSLPDQVADRGNAHHHLESSAPAPSLPLAQHLRDHPLEARREHGSDLILLLGRELIDD